ncbi:hypothetical protein, partial [Janthinobacterium sp. NKUCC08_JDC]|uniref:hypothetical protein n=1 Tax=Janthinobacterium sp. NKUCC08_JDC TaxID=2842122 RepID=UPI001C5B73C8
APRAGDPGWGPPWGRWPPTLGLRTIAGGVESGEQLELLAEMGCDEAFGYFLGRAVAPEDIEALLKSSEAIQN